MKKISNKRIGAGMLATVVILCAAIISGGLIPSVSGAVYAADNAPSFGNYYMSDYGTRAEVVEAGKALNEKLFTEGVVLLKNEDGALPLATEKKITLFGKNLYSKMTALPSAFRRAGYSLNPDIEKFYQNSQLTGNGSPGHPGNGVVVNGLPTGEADISLFNDANNSMREYNDAAIVAFYRSSGEGFDLPRTMGQIDGNYKIFGPDPSPVNGARAVDDHSLQLDANEAKVLAYACERFEKVIVLLNTSTPVEAGFLDDPDHYAYSPKIKGAFWTFGQDYNQSWPAVVSVIKGDVSPSGRLPDTYPRDMKADPTWNNSGSNFFEDYKQDGKSVRAKGNQYENLYYASAGTLGTGGYYSNYIYYKEGIYSGYRYWETRGAVEGLDTPWTGTETDTLDKYAHGSNEAIHYYSKLSADRDKQIALDGKKWNNWYEAHVVYPFGYGLSYTDFKWELESITDTLDENGKIKAKVKVENIGGVAGKDVVQLYVNTPYIDGGIEKAHVKLAAFAKTDMLYPKSVSSADKPSSQSVTLEFNVRDMASYDYNDANGNGFKGYELDAGEYNVYIGKNAHCWADAGVIKKTYSLATPVRYETDGATGQKVENRFDDISEQLLHEDRYPEDDGNNQKDMYMSRSDFNGTFPTLSYRLTAEDWIVRGLEQYNDIGDSSIGHVYPEDKETDPWYNDDMPTTGVIPETPIKLADMHGVDYDDDEKWDPFLDQLTKAQLRELAMNGSQDGYYKAGINLPELGMRVARNDDTPTYVLFRYAPGSVTNVHLCDDVVTAATWNTELAHARGNIFGNIAMWGTGTDIPTTRVTGWFAPAVNVHRNQFGGRNAEYFSEDGLLTGKISAQIVKGAQEKGMYCYLKHFAVNSQETNRCGLITWADEQAMREVYFTPFEICVKEGKTHGIMSALNRLGPRWTGGCYELLTNVLRDEWGFRGSVVTDSFGSWSNADIMIRAGGSLAIGAGTRLRIDTESATVINCLRKCAHDILYALANSTAINESETPTVPQRLREFNAKELEVGMVNTAYSQDISDCVVLNRQYYPDLEMTDVEFSLDKSSVLPRGLTISPGGVISGTPKSETKMTVIIVAAIEKEKMTQTFELNIIGESGAVIYGVTDKSIKGIVGSPLSCDVAKARVHDPFETDPDTLPPISYTLGNGSVLPAGLELSANGKITGTPVKECRNYSFTVVASAYGYGEAECTFVISVLYALEYAALPLEDARYGQSYVADIGTAVCDSAVEYSLKDGSLLPAGLLLTSGGYIVGVPQEAGITSFTVVATAEYAESCEAVFSLIIDPAFDSATELPSGKLGEAYMGSVGTAQGTFDITYSIVGGALPAGLKFSSDGTISGTPEKAGTYQLTVRAEDGALTDEITLDLFVAGDISAGVGVGAKGSDVGLIIGVAVEGGIIVVAAVALAVLFLMKIIVIKKPASCKNNGSADDTPTEEPPSDDA